VTQEDVAIFIMLSLGWILSGGVIVMIGASLNEFYDSGTLTAEQFNDVFEEIFLDNDYDGYKLLASIILFFPLTVVIICVEFGNYMRRCYAER